jgi:site-specific recombinase XerD
LTPPDGVARPPPCPAITAAALRTTRVNAIRDPPPVDENIAVMRRASETAHGLRTRALIVLLWRAGLRVGETLALAESDLDRSRGSRP